MLFMFKLPYFMNELTLTELDMGMAIPKIHRASEPSVDYQGKPELVLPNGTFNHLYNIHVQVKLLQPPYCDSDSSMCKALALYRLPFRLILLYFLGLWFDLDISYTGSFLMTLETKMNLTRLGKEAEGFGEQAKEGYEHKKTTGCGSFKYCSKQTTGVLKFIY